MVGGPFHGFYATVRNPEVDRHADYRFPMTIPPRVYLNEAPMDALMMRSASYRVTRMSDTWALLFMGEDG